MTDRRWVFSFDEPLPPGEDAKDLLGGKGASLAQMTQAGLRVPLGFTITTRACSYFYQNNGRWPAELEPEIQEHLLRLEEHTGLTFGCGNKPLLLSVRSGAAASMPGMMDTILNCGIHPSLATELGDTPGFWRVCTQFIVAFARSVADVHLTSANSGEPSSAAAHALIAEFSDRSGRPFPEDPWESLHLCIGAVFRSWNSERAVAYRKRHDMGGLPGTAVNVQAIFPSRVSGVVFTENPNQVGAGQMVIESSFGLGEAVVSGDVTPDRFTVNREDFSAVRTCRGSKAGAVSALGDAAPHEAGALTLLPSQIAELCGVCLRIEEHFGAPMDIEWGWAEGEFALLQARPIRGLDVARDAGVARTETIRHLRAIACGGRRIWVMHNLSETLGAPTPLTWDIVRRFMSGSGGFGLMYRDFGYRPAAEVCERGFLELICGRIYADPEHMAQLFGEAFPMSYDLEAVVRDKTVLDHAPTKFDAMKVDESMLWKLPGAIRSMLAAARRMKLLRATAISHFEREILPPYLGYVRSKRAEDLSLRSNAELIAELHDRCEVVLHRFGKEALKPAFFGGEAFGGLHALLVQLLGESNGGRQANALTMALENDSTCEQDVLLYAVAKKEATLAEFLDRFGHRATGEMELAEPRWREDAAYLEGVIVQIQRSGRCSMAERHDENVAKQAQCRRDLPGLLSEAGGSSFSEEIERHLEEARALLPYRERGKHYLMMGYELIRLVLVELSRRWNLGQGIFFLHLDELEQTSKRAADLRGEIERRKLRWKSAQRVDLPDIIDSDELEQLGIPRVFAQATEWQGDAVSGGVATGTARIVSNPRETDDLGLGYVLVCPSTDPGWTPLFINAHALIVERGGVLSHGAIVARDFGIPAIVCPGATSILRSGERIRVDGNSGKMTRLEKLNG